MLGFGQLDLGIPDRIKILLKGVLVVLGKFSSQQACIIHQQIKALLLRANFADAFLSSATKSISKICLGLFIAGMARPSPVEGLGLGAPGTTDASVGGHDQRRMPRFIADIFGIELIEGNRILVRTMALRVGSRQILVGIGMTVNALTAGWERPAYTVTPLRRGSRAFRTLVNSKSFSPP